MSTAVTIHGTGFKGIGFETGPSVIRLAPEYGPTNVTSIVVVSDSIITCVLPVKDPVWGPTVRLWITTPYGTGSLASAFRYTPVVLGPEVQSSSPPTGPFASTTEIVITGLRFTGATEVSLVLGGVATVLSFVVNSDTQITAQVPPGPQGDSYAIRVTAPFGAGTSATDLFAYV